jgi:hypothetical protein
MFIQLCSLHRGTGLLQSLIGKKIYLFDIDSENFYTAAVCAIVVDFILERTEFSEDSKTFSVLE